MTHVYYQDRRRNASSSSIGVSHDTYELTRGESIDRGDGGSLLVLRCLMLTGTVVALTLATPILVIFSPVLVPAVITVSLLATRFLTSGGLVVVAETVLGWMYKYMTTGGQPTGMDSMKKRTRHKFGFESRGI